MARKIVVVDSRGETVAEPGEQPNRGEDFETLVLDLSLRFVNLPPDEVDREVHEAQSRVCERNGLDLSALWQWDPDDGDTLRMTHLHRPLGGPPVPDRMDARAFWPWCLKLVREGRTVVVSTLDELPGEAATDRQSWMHYGVVSTLCFPLVVGGGPTIGALSFNTMHRERTWPPVVVRRLAMIAQLFANALARKRADEALRESEQKLALAADSAGAGVWSLDLATGRFWATPRTLQLLGLPENTSLTLDRLLEVVHPLDRDAIRRTIEAVVGSGQEGQIEYRILRSDGTARWLASRGRVRSHQPSGARRLTGVTVDISQRKHVEEMTRDLTGRIIAAHEDERARLARELHDDITQRLVCLTVEIARLEALVPSSALRESLRGTRTELARVGEDVHALSYRLHPTVLVELGLNEAIRAECERFTRQHGIRVDLALCVTPDSTPKAVSLCLYRVAQQALQNISQHAAAGRAELAIREREQGLELKVRDDGCGFDASVPPKPPALGLSGMRERVRHLGGRLEVDSSPGQGTVLRAWLPIDRMSS